MPIDDRHAREARAEHAPESRLAAAHERPREIRLTDEADEIAERRLQNVARPAARSEYGDADEPHEHIDADRHSPEPRPEQDARQQREKELQRVDIRADGDADEGADGDERDEERTENDFSHFHEI